MVTAFALLLVAAGVLLAAWWALTNRPQIAAGIAASLVAVVAGVVLLMRGPIVERSVDRVATLEQAAASASADAQAIRDLLAQIEMDGRAAVDRASAGAAESRRIAAQASEGLADTERRLAQLNARIEHSGEALRSLQTATAEAQVRPTPVELPPASRALSEDQFELLATSLRAAGSHELTVSSPRNDTEANELADRLKSAVEAAGWTVHGVQQVAVAEPVFGVQVLAPVPLPAHATTLIGALGRAGLQPRGLSRQSVDRLEVVVGSKPGRS
jgi:hypothetical protein